MEYKFISENGVELILEFFQNNNSDDYIEKKYINSNFFKSNMLRKLLFNANIMIFASLEDNKIKNLAILNLPDSKSKVIACNFIYISNNYDFINKCVSYFQKVLLEYELSKIKVIINTDKYKSIVDKLEKLHFIKEVYYVHNNKNNAVYSKFVGN